jgi:hypothetical protein
VALRLAAPALAVVAAAFGLGGAGRVASLALLAAIVAASARLLLAVGDAAEGRGGRRRLPVVLSVAAVACLVAAGGLHLPLLAFGVLVCALLELLVPPAPRVATRRREPLELVEPPVSRAA